MINGPHEIVQRIFYQKPDCNNHILFYRSERIAHNELTSYYAITIECNTNAPQHGNGFLMTHFFEAS